MKKKAKGKSCKGGACKGGKKKPMKPMNGKKKSMASGY